MKFYLDDEKQGIAAFRRAWEKCLNGLKAGKQFQVEIKYKQRSNDQNEMIHAIISQIAKQATHIGSTWSAEDWKRLTIHKWAQETSRSGLERVIPALGGGGIVQLGLQSRKFTKEDASEFIDWLISWAAQNGITLNEVS